MLLREIVLHNFGGYRGRHVIDVTPPDVSRPIILFGGLNGAGKTTLLDSMQLALYGRRARCAGRGNLAYEEYLRRCINRSVSLREGAAVELCFEATFDGAPSLFRVHRSWEPKGSGVREHLDVSRDNIDSMLLAERWDEIVEELMPLDIASLFFFDGEKIEALADPERAGLVISTAIDSLLGLNLLDRLTVDLNALERKKRALSADDSVRERLELLDAEVAAARADRARALQERAARLNDVDRAELGHRSAKDAFRKHGGELFEKRGEVDRQRAALRVRLLDAEHQLVDAAASSLPLCLVPDLLKQVVEQRRNERNGAAAELVNALLEQRDTAMLSSIESTLSKGARSKLLEFLDADRDRREGEATQPRYLAVSADVDERLAYLWPNELERLAAHTRELLVVRQHVEDDLDEVDRTLAAVPAADAIAVFSQNCDEALRLLTQVQARLALASDHVDEANTKVMDREGKLDRAYRDASMALAAEEDAHRIVDHAGRVRETLERYRRSLLDRHLSRIEAAVLDSLRSLLRKQRLISDLRLDPDTFALALFDGDGNRLATERLSAGERQLLAVALLWGLARVSGRELPTIIDTPLGRLDSTHRRLIADRYFPNASRQVLLLSTDEEIDERLLEVLRPSIGRTYELRYDDNTSSTRVVDGYFWHEEGAHVA